MRKGKDVDIIEGKEDLYKTDQKIYAVFYNVCCSATYTIK